MRGHDAQQELVKAELNVTRARAAMAEEQRQENIAAYRAATKRGRELAAEYQRAADLFATTKAEAEQLHTAWSRLQDQLDQLYATEPDTVEDFPSEEAQAAWEAQVLSVVEKRDRALAEARAKHGLQAQYQLRAINAGKAYENQKHVVRNLKNKIDDPNGEIAIKGWLGGVAAPQ
jgi:chromosome segregation ATPase